MLNSNAQDFGYEMNQINIDDRENNINNNLSQREYIPMNPNSETINQHPKSSSIFSRLTFQSLLILSVVRLTIYLNKLYQDVDSVTEYLSTKHVYYFLISVASLAAPPIIYAVYLIGANLSKDEEIDKTEVSTKTVNGFLLIPWQIKRHLDVLHFAAQRACYWRSPDKDETENIQSMKHLAEVLEFFEDFYAGFLQILLQLYILFLDFAEQKSLGVGFLSGQLIGSSLCVLSMMGAIRRRDDGPLTFFLSFIGWISIFVSRVMVFSLVATFLKIWFFILCMIHILAISIWVYSIAIESYYINSSTPYTWTLRKKVSMAILVFLFFGVPSLLFWPIMFQLKEQKRPLIFLLIITVENILLISLWFMFQPSIGESQLTDTQVIFITIAVLATLAGVLFLTGYILCKPNLTDQVVLCEMKEFNGATYGIYFEFCDIVFKLPNTQKIARDLQVVRQINENL